MGRIRRRTLALSQDYKHGLIPPLGFLDLVLNLTNQDAIPHLLNFALGAASDTAAGSKAQEENKAADSEDKTPADNATPSHPMLVSSQIFASSAVDEYLLPRVTNILDEHEAGGTPPPGGSDPIADVLATLVDVAVNVSNNSAAVSTVLHTLARPAASATPAKTKEETFLGPYKKDLFSLHGVTNMSAFIVAYPLLPDISAATKALQLSVIGKGLQANKKKMGVWFLANRAATTARPSYLKLAQQGALIHGIDPSSLLICVTPLLCLTDQASRSTMEFSMAEYTGMLGLEGTHYSARFTALKRTINTIGAQAQTFYHMLEAFTDCLAVYNVLAVAHPVTAVIQVAWDSLLLLKDPALRNLCA